MPKVRKAACLLLLALVVLVDFASRFLSFVADGTLVAMIIFIALPILKKQ